MKLAPMIALALLLINVEAGLLHLAGATLVKVDVGAILIAFMALDSMPLEGALGAFLVGYFQDVLCGRPTALYEFLGVLTFLAARVAAAAVDVRGVVGFASMAALTSLTSSALWFAMTFASAPSENPPSAAILAASLPTALWTALFAVPLFRLLKRVERRFSREETGLQLP